MKRILKYMIDILIIFIILFGINTKVFAWSEVIDDAKAFVSTGDTADDKVEIKPEDVEDLSGFIYNILFAAGIVISVIVATVLGVQFMIGGAEGKAKVMEMLVPFIIGCVVVFGAFGLWKIAITVGKKIENASMQSTSQIIKIAYIEGIE